MKKIEQLLEQYLMLETPIAEERLLQECMPILGSKIRSIYGIRSDYQDVTQDGAILLLESIRKYRDKKIKMPFLAFINSTCRFFALDLWKAKKEDWICFENVTEQASLEDCPEQELLKKEMRLSLYSALISLSYHQQDILVFHYLLNIPLTELSVRWDIPYSTLKKQHKKALVAMKQILEKKGEEKNESSIFF